MSFSEDSLTYPMESDDWIKTIIIGGLLGLFSFLIVPGILVSGYVVRAVRERAAGATEPPVFDEWGELLVDGLKATVIGFVYMLIPLAVFAFTVGTAIVGFLTGTDAGAGLGLASLLGGFVVSGILSLIFGYFAVAAVVNFACEDSLGAAFDIGALRKLALSTDYAVPWLISVGIFFAAGIAVSVLNVVPGLGAIIGPFFSFYAYIVAAELWAGGYNDVMKRADETEPSAAAAV
ncbi:DUF4013 domain-containing protein [Haloarcula pelagica]|uniref:DUF4013 domain-containing protein n=1 Tax=Haloarcula pelagica TaxID=3033389 RepID=UPI0024C318EF|nr:DUF4013 domain-containing protein [Halomicroarcula sp. YJ-61-S]